MILWEVKPDLVIEIGTHQGGSALYLADQLDLNGKGEVHTIDIPANKNKESALARSHPRIHFFNEGFMNYDDSVLSSYTTILVIDDGSHQYRDALGALNKFAPFVSKDSYFIMEDGIVTELGREKEFGGGPQKAIREFLTGNKNFIRDERWCDFFGPNATFNVNGYLKRIA
jgi:cephalosporin hydroxylase